jgi:hypothetical protein
MSRASSRGVVQMVQLEKQTLMMAHARKHGIVHTTSMPPGKHRSSEDDEDFGSADDDLVRAYLSTMLRHLSSSSPSQCALLHPSSSLLYGALVKIFSPMGCNSLRLHK